MKKSTLSEPLREPPDLTADAYVRWQDVLAALDRLGVPALVRQAGSHVVQTNEVERRLARQGLVTMVGSFEEEPVRIPIVSRGRKRSSIEIVAFVPKRTGDDAKAQGTLKERLTARQGQVLALVIRGLANKDIADRLGCTESTVEQHLTVIMRKAGVDSRGRLMALVLGERSECACSRKSHAPARGCG